MRTALLPIALAMLRAMRPRQWAKNAIVYAGIVFDGQLFNLDSFLRVTASFFLLCLISGAIYIINDLVDIESDRQHHSQALLFVLLCALKTSSHKYGSVQTEP